MSFERGTLSANVMSRGKRGFLVRPYGVITELF